MSDESISGSVLSHNILIVASWAAIENILITLESSSAQVSVSVVLPSRRGRLLLQGAAPNAAAELVQSTCLLYPWLRQHQRPERTATAECGNAEFRAARHRCFTDVFNTWSYHHARHARRLPWAIFMTSFCCFCYRRYRLGLCGGRSRRSASTLRAGVRDDDGDGGVGWSRWPRLLPRLPRCIPLPRRLRRRHQRWLPTRGHPQRLPHRGIDGSLDRAGVLVVARKFRGADHVGGRRAQLRLRPRVLPSTTRQLAPRRRNAQNRHGARLGHLALPAERSDRRSVCRPAPPTGALPRARAATAAVARLAARPRRQLAQPAAAHQSARAAQLFGGEHDGRARPHRRCAGLGERDARCGTSRPHAARLAPLARLARADLRRLVHLLQYPARLVAGRRD